MEAGYDCGFQKKEKILMPDIHEDKEFLRIQNHNNRLNEAFLKIYGFVAGLIYTLKKAVQLAAIFGSYYYFGRIISAIFLGTLLLLELLDVGYEKMMSMKSEVAKFSK